VIPTSNGLSRPTAHRGTIDNIQGFPPVEEQAGSLPPPDLSRRTAYVLPDINRAVQ
jgi:hypothetical protein